MHQFVNRAQTFKVFWTIPWVVKTFRYNPCWGRICDNSSIPTIAGHLENKTGKAKESQCKVKSPARSVSLISILCSHLYVSLPLVKLDEDGEGSTLRLSLLPKGHPRGEDPPEELLPISSPCVRLKLTVPSPNKSELTASILRHELAPSILNSYLSSEPASIRSHSDSLRDHHQAQIHCLARKSVYFHTHRGYNQGSNRDHQEHHQQRHVQIGDHFWGTPARSRKSSRAFLTWVPTLSAALQIYTRKVDGLCFSAFRWAFGLNAWPRWTLSCAAVLMIHGLYFSSLMLQTPICQAILICQQNNNILTHFQLDKKSQWPCCNTADDDTKNVQTGTQENSNIWRTDWWPNKNPWVEQERPKPFPAWQKITMPQYSWWLMVQRTCKPTLKRVAWRTDWWPKLKVDRCSSCYNVHILKM